MVGVPGCAAGFLLPVLLLQVPAWCSAAPGFSVKGPAEPIMVLLGADATLPCQLSPEQSTAHMHIRWYRAQLSPAVLVYKNGQEQGGEQMLEYRGRTELVGDSIGKGAVALLIHHVRASDNGQYRCQFKDGHISQEATVELHVIGLGSDPHVHMTGPEDGGIRVLCSSGGWFPNPRVQWSDKAGVKLPSRSESLTQDGDGLFHVEASLVVMDSSLGNVTCSVQNPLSGQEKESTIFLPEPFFPRMSPWKAALAGTLPVLVLLLIGISYAGWREHLAKVREITRRDDESDERDQMKREKEKALNAKVNLEAELERRKNLYAADWKKALLYPEDFRVIGPAPRILARVGEDALLTCQLFPERSAEHMEVRWYRSEPSTHVLLAHRDGAEVSEMQAEEYRGRVEWVEHDLAKGSVALKMHNIRSSDNGQYWCRFQEGAYHGETSLLLQVAGLGSAPHIHMEGSVAGEIQLVCTAEGWFPEPRVHWEDSRGEKLLTLSEHHIPDEDGLFHVEATLMVRNASIETVSCSIHNPVLTEEKGTVFSIPEKLQTELASLKVIGPSQPLLVRVGEDIQLTCCLSPEANAQSMEVRWVRAHHYPAVYVYMDGDHVSAEQMAEYRGRTVLVADAVSEGRLTLQIHDARTSDDGQYRCLFEKDGVYQESTSDVKIVGLGSSPRITMEGLADREMRLMCSSEGWFPQPRVQWRDLEGRTVPSFSEVLAQGSDGLFRVEAFLQVTNSSAGNVTCSIGNPLLGEEKMTTFFLSDSSMTFSWKILSLLGLLLLGLPVVVAVGRIQMKSFSKVNETLDPNTAHPELTSSREASMGQSCNQTSHRDLTAYPMLQARRRGGTGRRTLRTGWDGS